MKHSRGASRAVRTSKSSSTNRVHEWNTREALHEQSGPTKVQVQTVHMNETLASRFTSSQDQQKFKFKPCTWMKHSRGASRAVRTNKSSSTNRVHESDSQVDLLQGKFPIKILFFVPLGGSGQVWGQAEQKQTPPGWFFRLAAPTKMCSRTKNSFYNAFGGALKKVSLAIRQTIVVNLWYPRKN